MKKIFSAKLDSHRLALGLALTLGTASLAQAQTAPATVLALGNVTQAFTFQGITYPAGSQTLTALDPSTGTNSTISPLGALYAGYPIVTGAGQPLGIATGQTLVGIDYRTANGDLYALGFNPNAAAPSANAQLYILRVNNATQRAELTSVGMAIRLELSDANRTNTRGVIPNIGFDFNPRVDRIRVVAPNRANYLLNPNTGGIAAQDGALFYAAGGSVTPPNALPYVGTAAYTNARLGLRGTTLYDIDVTAGNATLSTQAPLNTGQLNPQAATQFFLPSATAGNQGPFPLTSPTVGLGLDIYDATTAYLVEARLQNNSETTISANTLYTSNFYTLNLSTGLATQVANIAGGVPFFYSDLAAPVVAAKAWTGQVSDAWDNANNWFPMGVPTSADDVLIAGNGTFIAAANLSVARQPVVRNAQQTASLTLTNNALLITAGSGIVTMSGDFTNNDSQVTGAGSGSIVLAGTTPLDIGGNVRTDFWNLDIGAAGATTSAPIAIQRGIAVGGTLAIGTDQEFTLLSNANGTAYVVNNGGSVTGLATVQRYITPTNAGAGYRHYSSPVTRNAAAAISNTVADLATASGFTPVVNGAYNSANNPRLVQPYPTVFTYEQSRLATSNAAYAVGDFDNGFVSPSALTDVLATGRGYTVNIGGTQLVDFQGTLNTGNYSTGPLARGAQSNAGWHLLGNPYPGAISYSSLYSAATGVQDGLYVYKSNGQYTGAYSAYLSNGQGVNGGVNNIALGQGFFVRVQPGQTGAVNFTDAARTNQPETALFQRTASTTPTLAMTLRSGSAANQTRIYFAAGATSAFDNGYDAHYLAASHGLDLASDIVTDALAINGLPLLTGAAVAVPLRLHAAVAGTYTLAVDELANLPAGYRAYLRDGGTGSYTDLAATPSLPLTLTPADAATGRYAVVFATAQPLAAAPAALAALVGVYPNPAHGTATLVLPQALRGQASSEVTILNTLGQVVLRRTVAAGSPEAVELPLSALAVGMYTVRATTATGTVAKQLSVE